MFWGLILEPGKRYSQQVAKAFHVSMATLEAANDGSNDNVPVMLEYEDGREYMLCNLHKAKQMQCPLDLNFKEGEKIGFYSGLGKSRIHLTGYMLEDLEDELESSEEEEEEMAITTQKRKESPVQGSGGKKIKLTNAFDGDDDEEDEDDEDDDYEVEEDEGEEAEEEEEDDEEDEDSEEEDDSDELTKPIEKKEKLPQQTPNQKTKKGKQNENTPKEKKKKDVTQTPKTPKEQNGVVKTPHSQKNKKSGETPKPSTPQGNTPQKKTLQGGVVVVDTTVGNGAVAKPGGKVTVYYVGRLQQNNKQFDSTSSGPGFKFSLGRGEVIKGWDIGVAGMRVGGKRTITIPAHMAYGKKGQPPVIPPNSTLVFDVELRGVN